MKLKAVFLDKDGNLIPEITAGNWYDQHEQFVEGLQLLQSYGYLLVIVSNKTGESTGQTSTDHLDNFRDNIVQSCSRVGIYLDGFYHPLENDGHSAPQSRENEAWKTEAGLLLKAAGDMDIDLSKSWIVGDVIDDVEAGKEAGCKTVLVTDQENAKLNGHASKVKYKAKDLAEAARKIVSASGSVKHKRHSRKATATP